MTSTEKHSPHLLRSYHNMIERVRAVFEYGTKTGVAPSLVHSIQLGKDKAVELQELSREEAERLGDFLRRDIEDAAHYLANTEGDLAEWMRFDLALIEERLVETFLIVADRTQVELSEWAEEARHANEYRSNDITGPGTLQCAACDHTVHFQEPSHIPECVRCGGNLFKRLPLEQDE